MTAAINFVVAVLLFLATIVMEVVGFVDALLMRLMVSAGVPPHLQLVVLVVVAIILVVSAFRLLGGVLGFLISALLVLLVLHALFPGLHLPHYHGAQITLPKLPKLTTQ